MAAVFHKECQPMARVLLIALTAVTLGGCYYGPPHPYYRPRPVYLTPQPPPPAVILVP